MKSNDKKNATTKPEAQPDCGAAHGSASGWTDKIPNTPGYYWTRNKNVGVMGVLRVELWKGELQVFAEEWRKMSDVGYWENVQWSAAIYPPNGKLCNVAAENLNRSKL